MSGRLTLTIEKLTWKNLQKMKQPILHHVALVSLFKQKAVESVIQCDKMFFWTLLQSHYM